MKEIKCPNCGKIISVDDADYAIILNQVKNQAFSEELETRLHEMEKRIELEQQKAMILKDQKFQSEMSKKEAQIKAKEAEIASLKQNEDTIRKAEELKMEKSTSELKMEIERLKAELSKTDDRIAMIRIEEAQKSSEEMHKREQEIDRLKLQAATDKNVWQEREKSMKENYEIQIRQANEAVEYYKDMKIRLSTKMVGESLEQHCNTLYNTAFRTLLPTAYFEKDNDCVDGTKGDFIFRDYDEGIEYISIMFEMKNEMDTTATKHRNEDFLKKLDEDRRKKGCEYAVLVSLLEADNELYNNGIVDMSHRYEKMFVIRPQFFVPLISLLVQASRKTVEYRKKLLIAEQQSIDISKFEDKLNDFKNSFGKNLEMAHKKYSKAIDEIDKSIKALQAVKESLMSSEKALNKAGDITEDLTIKKLTRGNKSMRDAFLAVQNKS